MRKRRYKKQKFLIKSSVKKAMERGATTDEERLADYVLRLKGIRLSREELRKAIKPEYNENKAG